MVGLADLFSLLILLLLIPGEALFSQITSSPYSMFGLGTTEGNGAGVTNAMGGTGIAFVPEQYVNLLNPASASGMDSLYSFFEIGFQGKYTTFSTTKEDQSLFDANFKYAVLGFRIKPRWSMVTGIAPYSTIGYNINVMSEIEGSPQLFKKTFTGQGGVNKLLLDNSFRISKNLFFGINAVYLFGTITQSESSVEFNYSLENTVYLSNLDLNYGLNYQFFKGGWKYNIGLIYDNGKTLLTDKITTLTTSLSTSTIKSSANEFRVPRSYGAGFAFERDYFKGGVDFETSRWQAIKFQNPLLTSRNSNRYSLGFEIPSQGIRKGTNRMIFYRFGAEYCESYMVIKDNPINYRSLSFGAGIPVNGYLSVFNLSVEVGQNGTLNNGLIRETFCTFHIGISLKDIWFMKRRYM